MSLAVIIMLAIMGVFVIALVGFLFTTRNTDKKNKTSASPSEETSPIEIKSVEEDDFTDHFEPTVEEETPLDSADIPLPEESSVYSESMDEFYGDKEENLLVMNDNDSPLSSGAMPDLNLDDSLFQDTSKDSEISLNLEDLDSFTRTDDDEPDFGGMPSFSLDGDSGKKEPVDFLFESDSLDDLTNIFDEKVPTESISAGSKKTVPDTPFEDDDLDDISSIFDEETGFSEPEQTPIEKKGSILNTQLELEEEEFELDADKILGTPESSGKTDSEEVAPEDLDVGKAAFSMFEDLPDFNAELVDTADIESVLNQIGIPEIHPATDIAPTSPPPAASAPVIDPEEEKRHEKAQRIARVIVNEIRIYHPEKLAEGIKQGNIMNVLGVEIEKGRQHYIQRIPPDIARSTNYYRESLIKMLADGNPELFGWKS